MVSPEISRVRNVLRKRLMDASRTAANEKILDRMLLTLAAHGFVTLDPPPPPPRPEGETGATPPLKAAGGRDTPVSPADEYEAVFYPCHAEFRRRDGDIETRLAVCVPPDDAAEVRLFAVHSTPSGQLLVFGLARRHQASEVPAFVANSEASEMVVIDGPRELAFPLHTLVTREYFDGRRSPVQ